MIITYNYNNKGSEIVSTIPKGELPNRPLRYGKRDGDNSDIRSLKICSCEPEAIKSAFSVSPKKDEIGADIMIDWSKAIPVIDRDDFRIELKINGNLIESPIIRVLNLRINKISKPSAKFVPNENLIWGRDSLCGSIVIKPAVELKEKSWAYTFTNNEIRIPKNGGYYLKNAQEKDGYCVYNKNPWESAIIPVYIDFGNIKYYTAKTLSFQWLINGFENTEKIFYGLLNSKSNTNFNSFSNLVWGKDKQCGIINVRPTETVRNRLLYANEKNILRIKKPSRFYFEEQGAVEKEDVIELTFDPWDVRDIKVRYNFPIPQYSISKPKEEIFEYEFNSILKSGKVKFFPWGASFSPVLSVKKKKVRISEEELLIAEINFQRASEYQSYPESLSVISNNDELIRCDLQNGHFKYNIWLKEGAFKEIPPQPIPVVLTVSANNFETKSFTLTLSANQSEDENHIQLVAEDGLILNVTVPEVVFVPTDKVDIPYSVDNNTDDKVFIRSIDAPQGKTMQVDSKGSRELIRVIKNPDNKTVHTIEVKADYLETKSQSFVLNTKQKRDLTVLSTFKPMETLLMDTKYEKEYCGVLELEIDKSGEEVYNPLAYNDTTVLLDVKGTRGNYFFELEKKTVVISPNDDTCCISVYFSCEPPMSKEIVDFEYSFNGLNLISESPLKLKHKDYNVFGVWFKPIENHNEIPLNNKAPIKIGSIQVDKTWDEEGVIKHAALQWKEEEKQYDVNNVENIWNDENAYDETIELPEYFYFDDGKSLIHIDDGCEGKEFPVYFAAYRYFCDWKQAIGSPIDFSWTRRWIKLDFDKDFFASQNNCPEFVDPLPSLEVISGIGDQCQKDEEGVYQINMDYTPEQCENKDEKGLIVCRLLIHNRSLLSEVSKEDLKIEFDNDENNETDSFLSLSSMGYSVQSDSSSEINVRMNWDAWWDRNCISDIEFAVLLFNNTKSRFKLKLHENRYNNVYCIDLGTKGIVVCKMTNFLCAAEKLEEVDRQNRLESNECLLSSVTIIPQNEKKIIISPKLPEYNTADFVFCPTKFMVGQSQIPFFSNYHPIMEESGDKDNEILFSLVQPDDENEDNVKKYPLVKSGKDEQTLLTPQEFVQNVYQNIFHRLKGHGAEIKNLVLTFPNTYTPERLGELRTIIENRFPDLRGYVSFVPESDAAVAYYLNKCINRPDTHVFKHLKEGINRIVIYDMGAGTLDLSYVVVTKNKRKVRAVIERRIGIPIAGDYLDYVLMSCLDPQEGQKDNNGRITASAYSQKNAVGRIKPRIIASNNDYQIKNRDDNDKIIPQDVFKEIITDKTKQGIDNYLKIVVDQVLDTLLYDIGNPNNRLGVDRVLMSGRASLFEPILNMIQKHTKAEVCRLSEDPMVMKTCVAQGALLYNSMFANNANFEIRTKNRYHKIGIVYFAYDDIKDCNCAQYETIINPLAEEWDDAALKNGVLCKKFDKEIPVDLSLNGTMAYIIETDLKDADIKKLYQIVYDDEKIHNRTEMEWAFVNELYSIPQIGQGEKAIVHLSIDENNKLVAEIGSNYSMYDVVEDIEKNHFYRVIFNPNADEN